MTAVTRFLALTAAFALLTLVPSPTPVQAGCGCDHPPPAWAPIMPPFASAGQTLLINAQKDEFGVGATYEVSFGTPGWLTPRANVVADSKTQLRVEMPSMVPVGPVEVHVTEVEGSERGGSVVYDRSLFTAMALPRVIPAGDSVMLMENLVVAVSAGGTILVPFDLRNVLDPTQFAMSFADWPLRFGAGDVVFYNRDGVDLTLFTLTVDDSTAREWGSYYGWTVEDDAGLSGEVYNSQVAQAWDPAKESDLLTYWRHEFHTYAAAHEIGGSHEVSEGFHPDGSFHVDHDLLVVAISVPDQVTPGPRVVDLAATSEVSQTPIEPEEMAAVTFGATLYHTENATVDAMKTIVAGEDEVVLRAAETTVTEETAAAPTTEIAIIKAVYQDRKERVVVHATASDPSAKLVASGEGLPESVMTWNARKSRFEFKHPSQDDLNGLQVTVTAGDGATATAILQ